MPLKLNCLEDVHIQINQTPSTLNPVTASGVLWQAAPGQFLLDIPKGARYFVEKGRQITIQPYPKSDETEIERILHSTPLAAIIFQRNVLALHGAAVCGPKGAIILGGDSSAGKSTLLIELLKRGWKMLSDDLTIVKFNEARDLVVCPNLPKAYLWPDSFEKSGINLPSYQSRRDALFMNEQTAMAPSILRSIYKLSISNRNEPEIESLKGTDILNMLPSLLYNSRIANVLMDKAALFHFMTTITKNVRLNSLKRPMETWSVKILADIVEKIG